MKGYKYKILYLLECEYTNYQRELHRCKDKEEMFKYLYKRDAVERIICKIKENFNIKEK